MSTKASDFLRAMNPEPIEPPVLKPSPKPSIEAPAKPPVSRAGLKHIGGYLDSDSVEKVAILRARLKLDNSELLKLAIDELFKKQTAKRSFGDR